MGCSKFLNVLYGYFFPFATYSYSDEKQLYQVMCLLKKTHLENSKHDQI